MSKMIGINELDVTEEQVEYTCFGLGSCVGLFISDRLTKLAGAVHIPLPAEENLSHGSFLGARNLIDQLLDSLRLKGSNLSCLRAKMAGGAQVFENSQSIGVRNAQSVIDLLTEKRIYVAATDMGGLVSRTARFNTATGMLQISTPERRSYFI